MCWKVVSASGFIDALLRALGATRGRDRTTIQDTIDLIGDLELQQGRCCHESDPE